MANKVRGGKILQKRRGGEGWRRGRGAQALRGSGSDGTSDEDYVVAEEEEEEEEDGSFCCSYSSDDCREDAGGDAESTSCTEEEEEEEEEEEYDVSEYEEPELAQGRRPRKGPVPAGTRRKPKGKCARGGKSRVHRIVDEVKAPPVRKPRAGSRRRSRISDEGEEDKYDEDEDGEFAPDDDDGDEEYLALSRFRKTSGRKNGPVKRRRRRSRTRDSKEKNKKKKAPVKKRRKRRAPSSDDDDFVVDEAVLVERMNRKSKRSSDGWKRSTKRRKMAPTSDDDYFVVEDGVLAERTKGKKRKKKIVSKGKNRRSRVTRSDTSDADCDYTISEEELRDLQVGGTLSRREKRTMTSSVGDEKKGRGKEVDDVGKQTCGICLSEEQKGTIRGLLDCCAHYFCFACIMEWSKVESRCPLCKQRFKTISQTARPGSGFGLRVVVKRIPKRDQVYQPSEEEMRHYLDPYGDVVCMECQRGGDDHLMLLCDICDSPAHTYCVGHGREVPEGNWYCNGCRSMDPGSSNTHVQESIVEHGTRNNDLLDTHGETASMDSTNCKASETPQRSATLHRPHQSLSGVGCDASGGYHSSLRDHIMPLPASGFAASTLSGRGSIRRRIQIMLSGNSRLTPEGVVRNVANRPSQVESDICSSEVDQPGEMLHHEKESPENRINRSNNRLLSTPRAHTNFSIVEGAKARVQTMVKNHLNRLTRNNPLERRAFKDIARRATHTILAACGVQHRRDMVAMPVEPPPSCAHEADGELSGLVKHCCCSVCFTSFVGNVVWRLVDSNLQST